MLQPEAEAAAEATELAARSTAAAAAERRAVSPAVVVRRRHIKTQLLQCALIALLTVHAGCARSAARQQQHAGGSWHRKGYHSCCRQVHVDVHGEAGPSSSGAQAQRQRVFLCGGRQTLGQLLALLEDEGDASDAVRQDIESAQQVRWHVGHMSRCAQQ